MPEADKHDFKAWHDKMPGSPHKLIVTGKVTVPTSGWQAKLVEADSPGINLSILILVINATKPSGMANEVVSQLPLHFEKEGGDQYKQVTVRGGGKDFTIDVTDAE